MIGVAPVSGDSDSATQSLAIVRRRPPRDLIQIKWVEGAAGQKNRVRVHFWAYPKSVRQKKEKKGTEAINWT